MYAHLLKLKKYLKYQTNLLHCLTYIFEKLVNQLTCSKNPRPNWSRVKTYFLMPVVFRNDDEWSQCHHSIQASQAQLRGRVFSKIFIVKNSIEAPRPSNKKQSLYKQKEIKHHPFSYSFSLIFLIGRNVLIVVILR